MASTYDENDQEVSLKRNKQGPLGIQISGTDRAIGYDEQDMLTNVPNSDPGTSYFNNRMANDHGGN